MIIMWFSTVFTIIFCLTTSTLTNSMVMHKGYGNGGESVSSSTTGTVSAQLKAKVAATIDQWLNDINTVNNFVDTVGKVPDSEQISCMASEAFVAAQNEGTSNTDLQNDVTLDASGQAAAKALLGQFNIIGPAINDTIFNPGNLQKNLDAINGARCPPPQGNDAISQEGAVQAAAASAVGITVPPPATPAACTVAAAATH